MAMTKGITLKVTGYWQQNSRTKQCNAKIKAEENDVNSTKANVKAPRSY